jgi:ABC-type multidrug transport system ATPase subunit
VTEASGLDERLTARENVLFHARIRGLDRADAEGETARLLDRLGMADRAGELVRGLSTGLRRRVALARALIHRPPVLFLDEPTSGLDPEAARSTVELIDALAHEHGRTVVLCTHDLAEAGRLCRRMAVLRHGRLAAFGTPEELAGQIWQGLALDVDLGGAAGQAIVSLVSGLPGVKSAGPSPGGLVLRVEDRDAIPALVEALATRRVPVYGVVPRPATLEDVYFAVNELLDGSRPA